MVYSHIQITLNMENQFKNRIDHRIKFDMKLLRTFTNLRKKFASYMETESFQDQADVGKFKSI